MVVSAPSRTWKSLSRSFVTICYVASPIKAHYPQPIHGQSIAEKIYGEMLYSTRTYTQTSTVASTVFNTMATWGRFGKSRLKPISLDKPEMHKPSTGGKSYAVRLKTASMLHDWMTYIVLGGVFVRTNVRHASSATAYGFFCVSLLKSLANRPSAMPRSLNILWHKFHFLSFNLTALI